VLNNRLSRAQQPANSIKPSGDALFSINAIISPFVLYSKSYPCVVYFSSFKMADKGMLFVALLSALVAAQAAGEP
jgi:hypothetical protein